MNPIHKARYVYYDQKDATYKLGNPLLHNINHIVKIDVDAHANEKKPKDMGTVYMVDTVNDHHGYGLRVVCDWIDRRMKDQRLL